jgi:predicted O-methyltransferase YrrM
MIGRIKRKIQDFTNRLKRIEKKVDLNYQLIEDEIAHNQLLNLFDTKVFVPLTTWSVSPKEVLHVCNDIVINKRTSIIEFGSGFSTFCIAQLLKNNQLEANFVTIENNIEWAEELNKTLIKMSLDQYVKVIFTPLKNVKDNISKEEQKIWYDTDNLEESLGDISTFDLVIVDGPSGDSTPFARYSAIPFLKDKLSNNFSVFLDDTQRAEEIEIANDWHQILGGEKRGYNRYYYLTNNINYNISPYGNKY